MNDLEKELKEYKKRLASATSYKVKNDLEKHIKKIVKKLRQEQRNERNFTYYESN